MVQDFYNSGNIHSTHLQLLHKIWVSGFKASAPFLREGAISRRSTSTALLFCRPCRTVGNLYRASSGRRISQLRSSEGREATFHKYRRKCKRSYRLEARGPFLGPFNKDFTDWLLRIQLVRPPPLKTLYLIWPIGRSWKLCFPRGILLSGRCVLPCLEWEWCFVCCQYTNFPKLCHRFPASIRTANTASPAEEAFARDRPATFLSSIRVALSTSARAQVVLKVGFPLWSVWFLFSLFCRLVYILVLHWPLLRGAVGRVRLQRDAERVAIVCPREVTTRKLASQRSNATFRTFVAFYQSMATCCMPGADCTPTVRSTPRTRISSPDLKKRCWKVTAQVWTS